MDRGHVGLPIGGELVTVTGRVIDGSIAIGNFWIPSI